MKKSNNQIKDSRKIFIILLGVCLAIGLAGWAAKAKLSTRPGTQISCGSNCFNGWHDYVGVKTHVRFKYPKDATVKVLEGSAMTDKPENQVKTEDIRGYVVTLSKQRHDTSYKYSTAVSESKSDNFELNITVGKSNVSYDAPNPVDLAKQQNVMFLNSVSGFKYVLLHDVQGWGRNSTYLVQCDTHNSCTHKIKRSDPNFPYIGVRVNTVEGWRYGGAPLDYKSENYKTMTHILSSLMF